MMNRLDNWLRSQGMLSRGERVLCALSGGADSVAMTLMLLEYGCDVCAAHLNHGLRGEESARDEAFVRAFCERHGVALICGHVDAAAHARKTRMSVEEAARALRYTFLEDTAQKLGARKIATAHTAGDNLETMLLNLTRGTGSLGLAGIAPVRGRVIRPILFLTRGEVEAYLIKKGETYVTDSTNLSDDYTRNKIRHTVVPALLSINPSLMQTALTSAAHLREDAHALAAAADAFLQHFSDASGAVDVAALAALGPAVRGRVIRALYARAGGPLAQFTSRHAALVEGLLGANVPPKKCDLPCGFEARRRYDQLWIGKKAQRTAPMERTLWPITGEHEFGAWRVEISRIPNKRQKIHNSVTEFIVDDDKITGTVTLRARREGDRILTPVGHKTLKKLMIERKIAREERAFLPVLCDEGGVIAAARVGADLSRAADEHTNHLLKIVFRSVL